MPNVQFTDEDVKALASMPVLPDVDDRAFHNPSKNLQERAVGQSFQDTYAEAAIFLNYLSGFAIKEALPRRILDFGCGWGRMLRLLRFKKELEHVELHGCDITPEFLDAVRRSVPYVCLTVCKREPPLPYTEDWFEVIYAYSVFSHLSEQSCLDWGEQFARVLKPGGKVLVTTQGEKFLQACENWRNGTAPITHPWHELCAKSFTDPDTLDRYRAGEFLYSQTFPDVPLYGEAVVPKQWFEKQWGAFGFKVVDWVDTATQNYCAMIYRP